MRLIAEDMTMQDLKGVIADAKAEAARAGHDRGLKHGALLALLLGAIATALCFAAGLLHVAPPVRQAAPGVPPGTGPIGITAPPIAAGSSAGGSAPPLPGLPPSATQAPPRPASTPAVPLPHSEK